MSHFLYCCYFFIHACKLLDFLVRWDCRIHYLFDSRVALNPGLGGVRDVASAIFCHEQTQYHRACCFHIFDAVCPLIRKFG